MYRLSVILSVHHGLPFNQTNEYAVTVMHCQQMNFQCMESDGKYIASKSVLYFSEGFHRVRSKNRLNKPFDLFRFR